MRPEEKDGQLQPNNTNYKLVAPLLGLKWRGADLPLGNQLLVEMYKIIK